MPPTLTGLYAALCALLVIALGTRVVIQRNIAKVGIGDGADKVLVRRIRVHGNAIENIPTALLLLLLCELNGVTATWLHLFGASLLLGRVLHAFGLSRSVGRSFGRIAGMALTWTAMATMAVVLVLLFFGIRTL